MLRTVTLQIVTLLGVTWSISQSRRQRVTRGADSHAQIRGAVTRGYKHGSTLQRGFKIASYVEEAKDTQSCGGVADAGRRVTRGAEHTVTRGGKSSHAGEWGAVTLADEVVTLEPTHAGRIQSC